jgi:catechol 2,3-dioxygenase-like lactoylglutathione lyase family enzyme
MMHRRSRTAAATLLIVAALLGGCSKATSTNTDQASAVATDQPAAAASTAATLPVYPGATRNSGLSTVIHDAGKTTNVDYYDTKDDGPTVAAWYAAHLPADWERDMGAPGKKIAGVFSSPDQRQMVSVTGGDNLTEIMVSTEVAPK